MWHFSLYAGLMASLGGGDEFFVFLFSFMFWGTRHKNLILMIFSLKNPMCACLMSDFVHFCGENMKNPPMLILIAKVSISGENIESRHFSASYDIFHKNSAVFCTYLHHYFVKNSFQMQKKRIFRWFFHGHVTHFAKITWHCLHIWKF